MRAIQRVAIAVVGLTLVHGWALAQVNPVSRAQMAVFLRKVEHGSSYVPPACAGVLGDVPCPSRFADWIEELFAEGITAGCS